MCEYVLTVVDKDDHLDVDVFHYEPEFKAEMDSDIKALQAQGHACSYYEVSP